jgi:hypothetical protein
LDHRGPERNAETPRRGCCLAIKKRPFDLCALVATGAQWRRLHMPRCECLVVTYPSWLFYSIATLICFYITSGIFCQSFKSFCSMLYGVTCTLRRYKKSNFTVPDLNQFCSSLILRYVLCISMWTTIKTEPVVMRISTNDSYSDRFDVEWPPIPALWMTMINYTRTTSLRSPSCTSETASPCITP